MSWSQTSMNVTSSDSSCCSSGVNGGADKPNYCLIPSCFNPCLPSKVLSCDAKLMLKFMIKADSGTPIVRVPSICTSKIRCS